MAKNSNDYILWQAFRDGDEKAFSVIYNTYIQELFRYGIRFSDDQELIKDAIQELFIKLYNNKSNLGATDNIRFYLFKALKNRLIDEISRVNQMVSLSTYTLPFEMESFSDHDDDDWNVVLKKKRLQDALAKLSPRQREAIYLRYEAEMSLEEIAELLDMNYQSARNLVHRGIEKLRKTFLVISLFVFFLFL